MTDRWTGHAARLATRNLAAWPPTYPADASGVQPWRSSDAPASPGDNPGGPPGPGGAEAPAELDGAAAEREDAGVPAGALWEVPSPP